MDWINYHSRRAMQEFHAGMIARDIAASNAHLRLSSLHMASLNQLTGSRQAITEQGEQLVRPELSPA